MFKNVNENKESKTEIELANSLRILIEQMKEITEFNNYELKAISILQTDKYLSKMLDFFILNKKHLKRKHSKELLQALKHISETIGNQEPKDDTSKFMNLFRK